MSPATVDLQIPLRFCLACGHLILDWVGNGWKCQACGELQYPAVILCPSCRGEFAPDTILAHRRACDQLRYSADTRKAMRREEREWGTCVRPGDSDWGLVHVRPDERRVA